MTTRRSQLTLSRTHEMKTFVSKAKKYSREKHEDSVLNWTIEEKIDGLRARWACGNDGWNFYSASNRPFPTPAFIRLYMQTLFKTLPLDGELHAGRGNFQSAASIVRNSHSTSDDWLEHINYQVFDLVEPGPQNIRRQKLETIADNIGFVRINPIIANYHGHSQMDGLFAALTKLGAEGLILRDPTATYTFGYTEALLKIKTRDSDEFLILDTQLGDGRNDNRLGALILASHGKPVTTFRCGTGFSDAERNRPLDYWKGRCAEIEYTGLTDQKIPRHPIFKRLRNEQD